MIDKQLRLAGKLIKTIQNASSEKGFLKLVQRNNKITNKLYSRKKIKDVHQSETWIHRKKDGTKLRVCVYKSHNPKENAPGVLWIHGGGYAMGSPEQSQNIYKRFIAERDCVIVAPDYRLSGEAPYPAALEDCYEALMWMKNNTSKLGIRANQIMVGGDSAGGGLTAALTLYARDKGEVNIAFQMPLYPMIDDRMTNESAKENDAPVWNSDLNRFAWKLYLGELFEKDVPAYAAAARATDYSNLPPTVTFVGDLEPFRDETVEYVNNLRKAGVPVDFQMYNGCCHAFDVACTKAEVSKRAISFLMDSFHYAVENYFTEQN